jgi:branched-chain amino acid transport system substrate-binding protein
LRNAGYQGMFLVHDFVLEPPFTELAGAAADGTKVFCACTDPVADATPATNAFNLAFFKMFGTTPGLFANTAYDVTNMMLKGIGSGATSRRALNTWLGTHTYQGLTSSYRFTPNGELDPSLTRATVFTVGEIGEQNISGGVTG